MKVPHIFKQCQALSWKGGSQIMNLFEKYKDYVVFTSLKKELHCLNFKYNDSYIAIYTNQPDKLKLVFDEKCLFQNCDVDVNNVIGKLVVYCEAHLFERRYDCDDYTDGKPVLKSHPMYVDGIINSFFEVGDLEIHIFHYPREIININNKKSFEFCSFVGTNEDVTRELLSGVKKIISRYNHLKGIFSIHGAGLGKEENGYLFLSGSRAGKSTLFVNLVSSGFTPINDDIVFWSKKNNNEIVISGCATLPQIRTGTFDSVVPVGSLQNNDLQSPHFFREIIKSNNNYNRSILLQAIFIPEIGHDKSSIRRINNTDVFRKELRACMVHGNYEIDECFLESIKVLNSIPTFKFCMSRDYNEVCQVLNCFLGDYS